MFYHFIHVVSLYSTIAIQIYIIFYHFNHHMLYSLSFSTFYALNCIISISTYLVFYPYFCLHYILSFQSICILYSTIRIVIYVILDPYQLSDALYSIIAIIICLKLCHFNHRNKS